MKKIAAHLFIFFCFLLINLLCAQSPQGFNYSAVARDATGKPLANRNVSVQLSILKTSPTGALQYAENHSVNTDGYGLFNLVVGSGTVQSGSISNIQWGSANHYLKVAIDANGGSNYITMGTTQIMSVPYALNAKKADNGIDRVSTTGDTLVLTNGQNFVRGTGSQGPQGLIGAQGPAGINGQNTLVKTSTEPVSINCVNGGTKLEYGLDANNNGTLDLSEINTNLTQYVCNGATGASGSNGIHMLIYGGGTHNWTVPIGVSNIIIEMWGAGGGGGKNSNNSVAGGSAGGYGKCSISVTPGQTYIITVGIGGAGICATCPIGTGGNGSASSFDSYFANGGNGGGINLIGTPGNSNCTINVTGGAGVNNGGFGTSFQSSFGYGNGGQAAIMSNSASFAGKDGSVIIYW